VTAAIGCDLGGTAIKLARLEGRRIASTVERPTPKRAPAGRLADLLAAAARELRAKTAAPLPLGVALPGFLDAARRRVVHLSNLPALDGFPLASALERRLRSPVVLDADSNAGAVAEARLGAGRGAERVLYVTIGSGLGAALVAGGAAVRASHHTIGQVAHFPLDGGGALCRCGQRGCAESLLSAGGIARRAGLRPSKLAAHSLWERAAEGDGHALAIWMETGLLLGKLVRALAGLFNPEVVVIGGGVAGAAEFFLPAAAAHLERTLPRHLRARVRLKAAKLGRFAGAAGAALLAQEHDG
jgi:glucokinase